MVSYGNLAIRQVAMGAGLNPYCSGRWSRTNEQFHYFRFRSVLILIVVEDGLVLCNVQDYKRGLWKVLILIVVEDGLVLAAEVTEVAENK